MDRFDDGIRCSCQETIDRMRARNGFRLGASVSLEFGPDASERERRTILIQGEPHDVLLFGVDLTAAARVEHWDDTWRVCRLVLAHPKQLGSKMVAGRCAPRFSQTLRRRQVHYCSAAGTKVPSHYCFLKQWRDIMISQCLAIAFLATASMTGAASAQKATNQMDSTTSATTHKEGEWRASKVVHVDVYN